VDIIFIGSLYDSRIKTIKELVEYFPNKKILAIGPIPSKKSFIPLLNLYFSKYRHNFIFKSLQPHEIRNYLSSSLIVLNLHSDNNLNAVNLRFFEIAGSNKVQIINYKKFLVDEFNIIPISFHNTKDIIGIIIKIFKSNSLFFNIANDIYLKTLKDHTYDNRAIEISNKVKEFRNNDGL
jgi:spore maturation protein CgeB